MQTPQLMPDWFYGFVPPEWWPDRPREPFFWGLNVLPLAANAAATVEQVFDKKRDVLVFGGCCLVSDITGTSANCPLSGTFSSVLIKLSNPAQAVNYTDGNVIPDPPLNPDGFVPLESLFSPWQHMGKRPVYWPMPIPIQKGGSLQMALINMNNAADKYLRFAFYTAILYEDREFTK